MTGAHLRARLPDRGRGKRYAAARPSLPCQLHPYCGRWRNLPASRKKRRIRPSGARPGKSASSRRAPRRSGRIRAARSGAGRSAQSRHRQGPRRHRFRHRIAAAARQFVRPPRRLRRRAHRAQLDGEGIPGEAAIGICRARSVRPGRRSPGSIRRWRRNSGLDAADDAALPALGERREIGARGKRTRSISRGVTGAAASQRRAGTICCARAAPNSASRPGRRTARRARRNPKAACRS